MTHDNSNRSTESNRSPNETLNNPRLPPGQHLVAIDKWPVIGEKYSGQPVHDGTLTFEGCANSPISWTLSELNNLSQTELVTDIHCVTRWSKFDMRFTGVLLRDLLQNIEMESNKKFLSFIACSTRSHSTSLPIDEAIRLNTLIALEYDGRPLQPEHGGPLRTIVPGKYFYKSLKWLQRIELLGNDRPGFWEAESGYHNNADPWKEQRYIASTINKSMASKLLASKDFSGQDLMGLDANDRNLRGLKAKGSILRNANFSNSDLGGANFEAAQLSNADFRSAKLNGSNFTGADLEGANFCGADLVGADLTRASLFGATFVDGREPDLTTQLDASIRFPENWRDSLSPAQVKFVEHAIRQ